jgi:hypothetical protein
MSRDKWLAYCRSGNKPADIPIKVNVRYKDKWISWPDWLGTKPYRSPEGGWRSFAEAREFVQNLGLVSREAWEEYCKSGKKPADIPVGAYYVYRDHWSSWSDWLGTRQKPPYNDQTTLSGWLPFKEAREFVRTLGLTGKSGWEKYCKSGNIRTNIPRHPNDVYHEHWSNWADWLGK